LKREVPEEAKPKTIAITYKEWYNVNTVTASAVTANKEKTCHNQTHALVLNLILQW
jgi:hypothetical protein